MGSLCSCCSDDDAMLISDGQYDSLKIPHMKPTNIHPSGSTFLKAGDIQIETSSSDY